MTLRDTLTDILRHTTPREWAGDLAGAIALFAILIGLPWILAVFA